MGHPEASGKPVNVPCLVQSALGGKVKFVEFCSKCCMLHSCVRIDSFPKQQYALCRNEEESEIIAVSTQD